MGKNEALEVMRQAVLVCQAAGVRIGIRVVEWQDEVDVVMMGVRLVDGMLMDGRLVVPEQDGKDGKDG